MDSKEWFYFDFVIQATLISMYSKLGFIILFEIVFNEMEDITHSNIWVVLIAFFAQSQSSHKAIKLLQMMLNKGFQANRFCASSIFNVIESINMGR